MGRPEKDIEAALSELVEVNRFVFLLMPGFSALKLGSGIDSLATANESLGKAYFQWKTASETGDSIVSSSGLKVTVDSALPDVQRGDCVVVCCAFNSQDYPKSGKAAASQRKVCFPKDTKGTSEYRLVTKKTCLRTSCGEWRWDHFRLKRSLRT
tara:strand:+ start:72 stop:533 length:462 start_codon:yes stop_codon:yes gene_type:complete